MASILTFQLLNIHCFIRMDQLKNSTSVLYVCHRSVFVMNKSFDQWEASWTISTPECNAVSELVRWARECKKVLGWSTELTWRSCELNHHKYFTRKFYMKVTWSAIHEFHVKLIISCECPSIALWNSHSTWYITEDRTR